jgi:hypothetical protein
MISQGCGGALHLDNDRLAKIGHAIHSSSNGNRNMLGMILALFGIVGMAIVIFGRRKGPSNFAR